MLRDRGIITKEEFEKRPGTSSSKVKEDTDDRLAVEEEPERQYPRANLSMT